MPNCSQKERKNRSNLCLSEVSLGYQTCDTMIKKGKKRRYACHSSKSVFVSNGHVSHCAHIIGGWKKDKILVIPQGSHVSCCDIGEALQLIAFAETALLKLHPALAKTKIYVKCGKRYQKWHHLGYWVQKQCKSSCSSSSSSSSSCGCQSSSSSSSCGCQSSSSSSSCGCQSSSSSSSCGCKSSSSSSCCGTVSSGCGCGC